MSAFAYRQAVQTYETYMDTHRDGVARGAVILSTYKDEGQTQSEYDSYCQGLAPVRVPATSPQVPRPPVRRARGIGFEADFLQK